ncbi:hypothetical protein I4U23_004864 [Adineta vaga]|nr:hypothetical protein I4U23_004858 [Adineta vaga]UJR17962.1 hypothetical protein I4U23_004861 [Adineta vaga]UJR17965.1 hypothetical protein I4U23_004864 [Adineta vaga]
MYKTLTLILLITVGVFTTINAATIERADIETGELELSEEQYQGLAQCDQNVLEVELKDKHQYRALKLIPYDIIIKPPTDCWWRYRLFMALNYQKYKDWANKYCRSYIGCWCCPGGGLCVTFIVKPDFWRCFIIDLPIFKEKIPRIPVFEPELDIIRQ